MALPAATVWEIRPTVGSDTNGGAFVAGASGTDYSQQNAANSSGNNQSTTDGVGNGTTTWTSATASFTSAIVGNVIYLSGSGITTGWYQVVSFTSGTTIVLDRSPGTGIGATMNIGGALAHISVAYNNSTTSNTIYVKATGSNTETTTLALANDNTPPVRFIGYTTTRGDGGQATWTTATNSTPLMQPSAGGISGFVFENFIFTNTAGTNASCLFGSVNGQGWLFWFNNCSFSGFTSAVLGGYSSGVNFDVKFVFFDNCLISGCTSHGVTTSGGWTFSGCLIQGNGGDGIHVTAIGSSSVASGPIVLIRTVVYNNTGSGINFSTTISIFGAQYTFPVLINSALDDNGADGITWTSGQQYLALQMQNSIIENNGGFGLNNQGSTANMSVVTTWNNAYRNNASGNFNGGFTNGPGDVALTAEPFNNPTAGDFSLNSTAGGGAACKAVGFPSSLP